MGVQPCEIEFDRFLLLIGEQASGKSTIAKLIYFFQSLPDAIYKKVVNSDEKEYALPTHLQFVTMGEFFAIFGSKDKEIDIEFHYSTEIIVKFIAKTKQYHTIYSIHIFDINNNNSENLLREIVQNFFLDSNNSNNILKKELLKNLNQLFSRETPINNYLIAGRNNVVAFSEYFESKVKFEVEKLIEDEIKGQDFQKRIRFGNEKLLLEFVNWSSDIRKYFQSNGGTFNAIKSNLENKDALTIFERIAKKILKGEYSHDSNGEYLKINEKERVQMKDASSGQQEVLRILQGFFLSIGLKNRREFFVVEEPEAHLYPLAQKELINAFALFLNTIKEGRLIITTHSPYILACVNILLFANYVANELPEAKKEVLESVQKDFWLDSKMFSAYSLGHGEVYCTNIKDPETGLIDQNYLDAISEQLGTQYNNLYNLLVENHV